MRLVYQDPIAELKILISKATQYANVSHIAMTSSEMRACLDSPNAAEVFPEYIQKRKEKHDKVRSAILHLRTIVNDESIPVEDRQPHFDRMDELQLEEEQILKHVPKMIREGKIVFKVSMH